MVHWYGSYDILGAVKMAKTVENVIYKVKMKLIWKNSQHCQEKKMIMNHFVWVWNMFMKIKKKNL